MPFAKQSVRLQRELVEEERPGASVPALAAYLLNYATRLAGAGEAVEAVPRAEEAVGLLRGLAEEDPEVFLPRLASALHALGNHRAAVSDTSGAIEAAQEACGRFRALAAQRPDAFRPESAAALDGLAGHLDKAGDAGAGLRAAEEAVALCRESAAQRPRPSAPASPPRCAPSPGVWPAPATRRRHWPRRGRPSASCARRGTRSWPIWPTPSRCSARTWS